MKRVFIIALAISVAGCTTAAQRQKSVIKEVVTKAVMELKICRTDIYNKAEYDSIREKMLSPANKFMPSMTQLADDSIPTKAQSKLIILYHDDIVPCRQEMLTKFQSIAPSLATVFADEMIESDQITLQLVKRKISWGEADKRLLVIMREARKKALPVTQQISRNLAYSDQVERAQRQATIDSIAAFSSALLQWSVNLAAINAANRPVVCNTNAMGSASMPITTVCQ